jgi:hypothetical protein
VSVEQAKVDLDRLTAEAQSLRSRLGEVETEIERIRIYLEMTERYGADDRARKVKWGTQLVDPDRHRERTMTGQEAARADGRPPGRRHQFTPEMRARAKDMLRENIPVSRIAAELGISKAGLYRYVKELRDELASETPSGEETKTAA